MNLVFWADKVAEELKKRKLPLEWVDDMKTPSGRIHVGSLRGVVVHDLVYKALKQAGANAKYTWVFDNHDPMDGLPVYLPKEKFEKYLGTPLFQVPSPEPGFKNYAEYYALEFKDVFNAIGAYPEIIWASDLYMSGKMNDGIRTCLEKAEIIRGIYEELYKKPLAKDWYPFQVYCENCGKVSTTRVYDWDGEQVSYRCKVDVVDWTKGCGHEGEASPFSSKDRMAGKLPWKIEWAVKWKAIGITVEGAGKDHMSRGGSHDLASLVCKRVIDYPVPYPIAYEFFLVGGKKMSSSKGLGSGAADMLSILPPQLLRFLMVKTKLNLAINFDPVGNTIPDLFDDYQEYAKAYEEKSDEDKARIFELSQIDKVKLPSTVRFSTLTQWVQMPNMQEQIKKESLPAGRQGLSEWVRYARIWVERFAPESEKFGIADKTPEEALLLSNEQKQFLKKLAGELNKNWNAEDLQKQLFEWAKNLGLLSKDAFAAIYTSLLGKNHGPKAGWLILSLDKEFVRERFREVSNSSTNKQESRIWNQDLRNFSNLRFFQLRKK